MRLASFLVVIYFLVLKVGSGGLCSGSPISEWQLTGSRRRDPGLLGEELQGSRAVLLQPCGAREDCQDFVLQ